MTTLTAPRTHKHRAAAPATAALLRPATAPSHRAPRTTGLVGLAVLALLLLTGLSVLARRT